MPGTHLGGAASANSDLLPVSGGGLTCGYATTATP
eukprot:CAMPEP_0173437724 /NCGR_PEP_ID=MMETSP1357-20121228/18243_1 /TAXON_ID=77926 /ORGANISM="Hemiselmis rufescens, Strain PCC563" /LENGTH=34 /DNA_ID= /DNA_START= /DNA_END= /DNA_ORIENTATION=